MFALKEVAAVQEGQTILVLGAAGAQVMPQSRSVRVWVLMYSQQLRVTKRGPIARAEGATGAIDYTQPDWRDTLKVPTGNRPINVIFDPIGGDISPIAFRTLGWRGRHLVVGFAAGHPLTTLQHRFAEGRITHGGG